MTQDGAPVRTAVTPGRGVGDVVLGAGASAAGEPRAVADLLARDDAARWSTAPDAGDRLLDR